ncbi:MULTISPECIES: sodium:solute symporter family transporter [unclassified Lentimonas]|uniref:sodium:solute symporter family transporter n=1 Tax=unclassified Lentimonas TaxID=2630993 RepID=UPI0013215542|nr:MULTISPECIES: sodium:solute symporter [unclassified Lentimonas]CAA6679320.1 Predicted sodium-dependent mannose transporter [Lentimonas sp. CC4]CAA6686357.1 Predicted sodium-dependent mannose transporter [Lentimonas sp. CC6]CAA7076131.1 Predicted sodium-dependent mannose transporter [Lentimonas sp. CC4]CAA7170876.1 Predicted sodium-dependent mannose transporter [Lentimonas sp. CC21]CAA7181182.1 Predicted sodium-dependent mannose transporter [Lentimonas sp. CC8]
MTSLNIIDSSIIAIYLIITMGVGLMMTRKASQSMDNYFLGGRNLPWYLLGMAGMAMWFDLTGTMIITAFLYMLGPKGLFIEFRGGAVLVLAFLICFTGKWHRRSGCMTGAEWIAYRFGQGKEAKWMRFFKAIVTLITTVGLLAYLVRGTSLFVGMFIPLSPMLVTGIIVAFCTVYTMLAGFYGVVLTDLVQGLIVLVACVIVSVMAFNLVPDSETLGQIAHSVTGSTSWTSSMPAWEVEMPPGYEVYDLLLLFMAFYLLRNVLYGFGTGDENRYFGARSDRDCTLQSILQGVTVAFRWPMMMGFAIMGLLLIHNLFPDSSKIEQTTAIIKEYKPDIEQHFWHEHTTSIINAPQKHDPQLIERIETTLGDNWKQRLPVVGYSGTVNPEQILPAVLLNSIPTGLRGLLIVAMLAAMMSTLTGEVNKTSAQFVKDIYQLGIRPKAKNRELIAVAYVSTGVIVALSFAMGIFADSINDIWAWFIMSLTAGSIGPYVLRLYWWRCNAWGQIGGTVLGGVGAVIQRLIAPEMSELIQFPLMTGISVIGTVALSYMTAPTPMHVLKNFYVTTRPFGWWKPMRELVDPTELQKWDKEHRNDMLAVPFVMLTQVTIFLLPMQLMIKTYSAFFITLPIFLFAIAGSYWFLWRNLPSKENPGTDRAEPLVQE